MWDEDICTSLSFGLSSNVFVIIHKNDNPLTHHRLVQHLPLVGLGASCVGRDGETHLLQNTLRLAICISEVEIGGLVKD